MTATQMELIPERIEPELAWTTLWEWISIADEQSKRHFAPDCIYDGVEGALRWGRELGYGMAAWPDHEIADVMGTLYGRLVRHTLGRSGGVPIDAKPLLAEIQWAIDYARKPNWPLEEREARLDEAWKHYGKRLAEACMVPIS